MKYTAIFLISMVAFTLAIKYESPADAVLAKLDSLV